MPVSALHKWPDLWVLETSKAFPGSSAGKESTSTAGDPVRFLGWEDPLEKGTATIPVFWPGESRELYSPCVAKSWTRLSDFHRPVKLPPPTEKCKILPRKAI